MTDIISVRAGVHEITRDGECLVSVSGASRDYVEDNVDRLLQTHGIDDNSE